MNTTPPFPPELWEQTPIAIRAYICTLEARIAALEATVQQLLERLQQDSHNSSRPPSSDPPHAMKQRPRRVPSGRKRGGQPGHQGQSRALVPIKEVDTVIPVKPQQCLRCQHPLQGDNPQPYCHQVTEVPPVRPVVTEYQIRRLSCPACGVPTRADLPCGVPPRGLWATRPADGILILFDTLLSRSAPVVELDYTLGRPGQIGHDEANAQLQLALFWCHTRPWTPHDD